MNDFIFFHFTAILDIQCNQISQVSDGGYTYLQDHRFPFAHAQPSGAQPGACAAVAGLICFQAGLLLSFLFPATREDPFLTVTGPGLLGKIIYVLLKKERASQLFSPASAHREWSCLYSTRIS